MHTTLAKPLVRAVLASLALASWCPALPSAENLHADCNTFRGSAAGNFEIMV